MKISPVQGAPTISNPGATGLSTEKLERIKSIAMGQKEEPDKVVSEEIPTVPAVEKPIIATESTIADANVPVKEATEATEALSPQLAQLALQKRALQVKEREINGKLDLAKQEAIAEYKAKLKSDTLGVLLEDVGPEVYNVLTEQILAKQSSTDPRVSELEAQIAELKKGVDSKFSESQKAQEMSAINYVADKLDALIASNPADFELLSNAKEEEEVIRRVYNHWKKTGQELDVKKVAEEYQNELADEAVRYAKLGLVQKRLAPKEPLQPQTEIPQAKSGIKTLTNKDSARSTSDRRQRAILAMQGQLKR